MGEDFVGREEELRRLTAALGKSRSGQGGLVAVSGEAGIGKTRLLAAMAAMADGAGDLVLWGRTPEEPGVPPYFPWTVALRSYLHRCEDASLEEHLGSAAPGIATLVPELRDRIRDLRGVPSTETGERGRIQVFEAVACFLLAASRRQPLVLLLDDLHLADRGSLLLLEHLAPQLAGGSALVVAAFRDSEIDRRHPLSGSLRNLARAPRLDRLSLAGLTRAEVARLLEARLGRRPPPGLADSVHERTEGNPLFVGEIGRSLAREISRGRLAASGAGLWIPLPESVREVIGDRLDGLPEECNRILGVAAVLGREFSVKHLGALLDGSGAERILRQLAHAERAEVIESAGPTPGRFRFRHALFRDALYGEHTTVRRVSLHRRVAEMLAATEGGDPDALLSQIAHHYFEAAPAGRADEAIAWSRRAARRAFDVHAFDESAGHLERALQGLELAPAPDDDRRFEILLDLGRAQWRAGHRERASATLLKAAVLAHRREWWERLGDAIVELQVVRGQLGLSHVVSVPLHRAALERLKEDALPQRVGLLASLGAAYLLAGELDQSERAGREAVALARRTGDTDLLIRSLNGTSWSLGFKPEHARERLGFALEARDLASRSGRLEDVLAAEVSVTFTLADLGEIAELRRELDRFSAHADEAKLPHFRYLAAGWRPCVAILEGRWADALSGARARLQLDPGEPTPGLEGGFAFQMFAIERARGGLRALAPLVERFSSATPREQAWLPGLALVNAELGRRDVARDGFERLARDDFAALPRDALYLLSLVYLAEVCVYLADERRAALLYDRLAPYGELNTSVPATVMCGAVARDRARLALVLGRLDEARALFERALERNAAMGARPVLAETRVDYARLLLRSGAGADEDRARGLLREARRTARELEMSPLLARIGALGDPSAEPEDLTARELEVLGLIGEGASNRQVADRLFISQSTVATHVRSILRKTGASNRTEAVAHARREGLLDRQF